MRGTSLIGRLPLRLKVTLVFAGAMAVLLAALSLFIYVRVQSSLDGSLSQSLRARADDVRALVLQADSGLQQAGTSSIATPDERFAQIVSRDGRVLDRTPSLPRRSLLSPVELKRASTAPVTLDSSIPGVSGRSRLLALPVQAQGQRMIVVVGSSLRQHDAALADLRTVLLLGGPVALLVASLLGYLAAALALRGVESMRLRASHISLDQPGQRLPVPPSADELGRLARTLNDMLERNETAFQREQTFVADASHELRSPLAILRAELEVALAGESSSAELRQAIGSAAEEAGRLSRLAENLLTLAQADQGSLPIHPQVLDLAGTVRQAVDRYDAPAQASGAVLEARVPDTLWIRADPLRLEQALGNLLENALGHGGETVVVEAGLHGDTVELHVSDNGRGFPAAFLADAFQRFTRADHARTAGGVGLGLSIVRSIARAHGGDAVAANGDGGGAHVWLYLPGSACGVPSRHGSTAVGVA